MSEPKKRVPIAIPKPAASIESFVAAGAAAQEAVTAATPEETKRLTIDIPESLHKRLRVYAAADGRRLAEIVRKLLDESLPPA